jgi:UDP-glucose 4-epimerase
MAKVLVTGSAGFIASNLVDLLVTLGHEVTGVDNLSTGKVENLNPKARFIEKDIQDEVFWKLLDKHDYVFHLASLARIQPSINDPVTSHKTNINGTLNILEYCRRVKAKLIFSGSSSIYEGEKLPISEGDPIKPKSPYALQKQQCEQYIRLYRDLYGLDYTILRYFNVFGERQITEGAYAAVVGIFLNQKAKGQKLTITNDGEQRRDFTYVKDVATANVMAMGWQGTFNIGSGKNYSINDIAEAVEGEKEYIGDRKGEARNTLADNSKARAKGWQPTVSIMEFIDDLVL